MTSAAEVLPSAGDYRLERLLGRGGTGEVWLGRHAVAASLAAVKVLRPRAYTDDRARATLEHEYRVVARLDHPHIVSVMDIGEKHVAFQFVDGTTLARRLTKPMAFALVRRIALQLASALAHAHARGVIHRDVKPGNVLLDRQENAYLTDFGIASSEETDASQLGVGTALFMPPEQRARTGMSPASDQYALARTVAAMLLADPAPPPDENVLEKLARDWPEALVTAMRRALADDPGARFPSVGEFAEALRDVPQPASEPTRPFVHLKRSSETFSWLGAPHTVTEHVPGLFEARHRISTLRDAGLLPRGACEALLETASVRDLGFSVLASTERLGPVDAPSLGARAAEVVVLLHGWACTRESFQSIALALCRDCPELVVIAPDVLGFGESPYDLHGIAPARLDPARAFESVLALTTLLGLRDVPTVIVGHSASGLAVLVGEDDDRKLPPARIALNAAAPFLSLRARLQMRLAAALLTVLAFFPRVNAFLLRRSHDAPEITELENEHRARSIALLNAVPTAVTPTFLRAIARSAPTHMDHAARTMIVHATLDPYTPRSLMRRLAERLSLPPDRARTLVSASHLPHIPNVKRPEDSRRCANEIVVAVEDMLVAARSTPGVAQTTITY